MTKQIFTIKQYFGNLNEPLHHTSNLSLQSGLFPDKMKTTRVVTPLFKGEGKSD